jgi:two-component system response regulator
MENKVILLVEDNARDEVLTLRALKQSGIANEIVVTRDGAEAIDYLFGAGAYEGRDIKILPQLIMLDLKMPKMDGLQVLTRLRAEELTKRVPIVVFTSSSEQEDIVKSYNLGANSYVRKPIDFEQFAEATRQVGMYWFLLNEAPGI